VLRSLCEYFASSAVFADLGDEPLFAAIIRIIDVFGPAATKWSLQYFALAIEGLVSTHKRDTWQAFINQHFKPSNESKIHRCYQLFNHLLKGRTLEPDFKLISGLAVNLMLLSVEYSPQFLPLFDQLMQSDEALNSLIQANPLFPHLILGLILRHFFTLTKHTHVLMFITREFALVHKRMDDNSLRNISRFVFQRIGQGVESNARQMTSVSDFVNEDSIDELASFVLLCKVLLRSDVCFNLLFENHKFYMDLLGFSKVAKESSNSKLQALAAAVDALPNDRIAMKFAEAQEEEEAVIEMKDMDPDDDEPHSRRHNGDDVD